MIKKRIGTDLFFKLAVKKKDGSAEDLRGVTNLRMRIRKQFKKIRVLQSFELEGENILSIQISSEESDLLGLGVYDIEVLYSRDSAESDTGHISYAVDFPKVFSLVRYSEEEQGLGSTLTGQVVSFGKDGLSAYEVAVAQGYEGSASEWLESLKGDTPIKGVDYWTESDKTEIVNGVKEEIEGLDLSEYATKEYVGIKIDDTLGNVASILSTI